MKDLFGNEEIRALNWKWPYSAAMLAGKIETRTWPTKYRGQVLICESKAPYSDEKFYQIAGLQQAYRLLEATAGKREMPGMAIAVGNLVDCKPMTKEDEDLCFVEYREPWHDEKFNKKGQWNLVAKQLWCHVYENVRIVEPFSFSALQGWKKMKPEEISRINYR